MRIYLNEELWGYGCEANLAGISLFDFKKHGADITPSPACSFVKQFSSGAPSRSQIRTSTAETLKLTRRMFPTRWVHQSLGNGTQLLARMGL